MVTKINLAGNLNMDWMTILIIAIIALIAAALLLWAANNVDAIGDALGM